MAEQPQRRNLVGERPGEEVGERRDLTGSRWVLGGCLGHAVPLLKREASEFFLSSRVECDQASIDGEPHWEEMRCVAISVDKQDQPGLEKGTRLDQDRIHSPREKTFSRGWIVIEAWLAALS